MNEKQKDRQQGEMNREREKKGGRRDMNPDRSRTGQVGGGGAQEDKERQDQRDQKGGQGQQKPGRMEEEGIE